MSQLPEISVIVPVFNEEQNLNTLYQRLSASLKACTNAYEILLVDDGSIDRSLHYIKQLSNRDASVKYISFSRNFGHQKAVLAGLNACRGNYAVIIDADLQDPPEIIPELYTKIKTGYRVVVAKRNKRSGETWIKKITAKLFYRLFDNMIDFKIPLDTGDFRIMDRKIINEINDMNNRNIFIRGQIAWLGYDTGFVSYDRDKRHQGNTKYSLSKMIQLALDGIISFSAKPLVLITRLGFFMFFISICIVIYALAVHFIWQKTITGWTSIIIVVSIFSSIQLLSLGIIGEYLARIKNQVQQQAHYVVQESNIIHSRLESHDLQSSKPTKNQY